MNKDYTQYLKRNSNASITNDSNEKQLKSIELVDMDESSLTRVICDTLRCENKDFIPREVITIFELLKGKRIVYSEISNFVYSLATSKRNIEGNELANAQANVDKLKNELNSLNISLELRKNVIKFYDHFHLAYHQVNMFKFNKNEFEDLIVSSSEINKKFDSINSQVLSLVALYTAMAFLVFGGLSSFESIFSNIQNVSIVKMLILSSVWGIGIINIIVIFMFFTSKIIGKSFSITKKSDSSNNSIFNRYPYLVLSNFILTSIFLLSCWMYLFITKFNINLNAAWEDFELKNAFSPIRTAIIVSLVIIIVILIIMYRKLFLPSKKVNKAKVEE